MKKVVTISLGGKLIIPDEIDIKFLNQFKKIILKHSRKYRFIIVCGGGRIARQYINALREVNIDEYLQSLSGIAATRANARFVSHFFNIERNIPQTMARVKEDLKKEEIVFCGALRYRPRQTSDSTAAEIARELKTDFINVTNVDGLYDNDPRKFKNAKLISRISWNDFDKIADKIEFKPGQNFVLDQTASKIILKSKIISYILGKDVKQLDNLLNKKKFRGTIIQG